MKTMKKWPALLLVLVMLLSLCACGAAKGIGYQSSSAYEEAPAATYDSAMGYDGDIYEEGGYYEEAAADYDVPLGFSAVNTSASSSGRSDGERGSDALAAEKPDKIIYSSDVTVETTVFDETVGSIAGLVEDCGGWIESSSVSGSNYYQKARGTASTRDASYTLRIPSARFTEVMERLSKLGNVPYSHIYTENVTSQYYDAQARLKAYKTQEERLLEMMELAETVEDVIIIEDRLTELRYQIESIQSSLNNWDRRVSYSTVRLSVKEVREYTPEEKVNPTYGEELLQALKDGVKNAGEFVKNLLVILIEALPVLLILALIVWILVLLIRKIIHGTKARREIRARRKEDKLARKQAKKRKASAAEADASAENEMSAGPAKPVAAAVTVSTETEPVAVTAALNSALQDEGNAAVPEPAAPVQGDAPADKTE